MVRTKTLKKYMNPENLISTAFHMYRSKGIRTWIVEGVCDKRFFSKWVNDRKIRMDGFQGKDLVIKTHGLSGAPPYSGVDFMSFFADVDYDFISGCKLIKSDKFYYHALCHKNENVIYNDLECFLLNTKAFVSFMAEYDQSSATAKQWASELEVATGLLGAYRAADEILVRREGLSASVLDGVDGVSFFDPIKCVLDIKSLEESVSRKSPRKQYVQDLFDIAASLSVNNKGWSLSRGHDVTALLSEMLKGRLNVSVSASGIERMLRLACDKEEFLFSSVGERMKVSGDLDFLLDSD